MIVEYYTPYDPFYYHRVERDRPPEPAEWQRTFILDDGHGLALDNCMEDFTAIHLFHQDDIEVEDHTSVDMPLEEATQLVCSLEHKGVDLVDHFFGGSGQ